MSCEPQRPPDDNRDAWRTYRTTQCTPWHAIAERHEQRQRCEAERVRQSA
jgi:hypothetical protein